MRVIIKREGEIIWYRDEGKKEGVASTSYKKDGTQQKIISALESALVQAKAELSLA